MGKKINLIIIIIIVILIAIGYMIYFNQDNSVNVNGDNFTLPKGYKVGKLTSFGDTNITNGTHSVFISKYDTSNITNLIDYYKNDREKNNETIELSNFTIDTVTVFKSVNKNTSSAHYWFAKNKHVYSIYNWEKNPEMDKIVFELISTMNKEKK